MEQKEETLANIYQQIEAYENAIYLNIGGFLQELVGLPVYVMDKPFIKPDTPYLALRIITSSDSGGWSYRSSIQNDMYSYEMDNTYEIELVAYRGRPTTLMSYVLAALRGAEELKYKHLYSKGLGFLGASNIAQANTIVDGDKTELRARMVMTFNTRMSIEDIATTPIEAINMHIRSFRDSYNDPIPLDLILNRVYVITLVPGEYSSVNQNGSLFNNPTE